MCILEKVTQLKKMGVTPHFARHAAMQRHSDTGFGLPPRGFLLFFSKKITNSPRETRTGREQGEGPSGPGLAWPGLAWQLALGRAQQGLD